MREEEEKRDSVDDDFFSKVIFKLSRSLSFHFFSLFCSRSFSRSRVHSITICISSTPLEILFVILLSPSALKSNLQSAP